MYACARDVKVHVIWLKQLNPKQSVKSRHKISTLVVNRMFLTCKHQATWRNDSNKRNLAIKTLTSCLNQVKHQLPPPSDPFKNNSCMTALILLKESYRKDTSTCVYSKRNLAIKKHHAPPNQATNHLILPPPEPFINKSCMTALILLKESQTKIQVPVCIPREILQ